MVWTFQTNAPTTHKEPFTITITVPETEIKAGAEIELKVLMTNTSRHDVPERAIVVANGWGDLSYKYDCNDASGKSVAREVSMDGLVSIGSIPALKSGKSRETSVLLNSVCDVSQPGKYEIQLSRTEPSDPDHRIVKSNKIILTVAPLANNN